MAALALAGIPLAVSLIRTFAPPLIRSLEQVVTGEKKGADRGAIALNVAKTFLDSLTTAGIVQIPTPPDEAIRATLESVFQEMKSTGALTSVVTKSQPNQELPIALLRAALLTLENK